MKYVNKTFKNKFQSRLSSSDQIPECEIQPSSVFFCSKVSTHSCTVWDDIEKQDTVAYRVSLTTKCIN